MLLQKRNTYVVKNDQRRSPSTLDVANGVKDTMIEDGWDNLLEKQSQQASADGCKVEVVDHEEPVQLEGWTVTHQLSATKDYNVVENNGH